MTTDRAAGLLRRREHPQQPTFLELFFDLVFIFMLNRVVGLLFVNLTGSGADDRSLGLPQIGKALVLLLSLAWIWTLTAWTTSRFNPARSPIQIVVIGSMFGTLAMSAAIPQAYGAHGLVFAVPYVAVQLGRSALFAVLMRGDVLQRIFTRETIWFAITAVPWLVGAVAHDGTRVVLWTLAVAVDYLVAIVGWPVPGLGASRTTVWAYAGEHLADRYRLFLIVALGESVLEMGTTFYVLPFRPARWGGLILAFATTVLFWRIYFYRAGQILGDAVIRSRKPADLGRAAAYAHLLMIIGIITTAAGDELVITYPGAGPTRAWSMVMLVGPAFFLAGRARFEHVVFARVSPSRVVGIVVLLALVPVMMWLPPSAASGVATTVLAAISLADARRARGRPLEDPSPPR